MKKPMLFSLKMASFALAALALACASAPRTTYLHENADLGAVRSVAVLPFESLAGDRIAADKVHDIFLVELLATGAFDVVEPGLVAKVLREAGIQSTETLAPADFQRLGEQLGTDGFFLGKVVDFTETRSGTTPAPEVTIQLRLVEALSGVTIWSASDSRSGATLSRHLIGVGGRSLTEAARELLRRQLDALLG